MVWRGFGFSGYFGFMVDVIYCLVRVVGWFDVGFGVVQRGFGVIRQFALFRTVWARVLGGGCCCGLVLYSLRFAFCVLGLGMRLPFGVAVLGFAGYFGFSRGWYNILFSWVVWVVWVVWVFWM